MIKAISINRGFGMALAISILWHIIAIISVNIIALPGMYKMRELAAVSFLGPILEKTALDIMIVNKFAAVMTNYEADTKIAPDIHTRIKDDTFQPRAAIDAEKRNEERMGESISVSFHETKDVPSFTKRIKNQERAVDYKESDISWIAVSREVFYKPEKPRVPRSVSGAAPFNMELKFSVSPQGDVQEVAPLVSSGSADADIIGIRYLKNWKFTPLESSAHAEQRGIARIVLSKE